MASAAPASVTSALAAAWAADPAGRLLLSAWAVTAVGVTTRAILLRRRARTRSKEQQQQQESKVEDSPSTASGATIDGAAGGTDPQREESPTATKQQTPFRRVLTLAVPSWRTRPVLWVGVLTSGIALRLLVSIKVNSEIGVLGSLLAKREWASLFRCQLGYALWAVPASLLAALQKYAATQASLSMRTRLQHHVHQGYAEAASLPLSLSAAGETVQRATGDTKSFCDAAVQMYEALAKPLIEVTLLSAKLASMMGGLQLMQCYGFFLFAGCWTRFVGPSISTMSGDVAAAEGKLVAAHAQVAEYAEEIAMSGGGCLEAGALDGHLNALASRSRTLSLQHFCSESLDSYVVRYLGILAAFTTMMPAVAKSAADHATLGDPTEYFLTCLHLLVNVGMACRDLFGAGKAAGTARAMATRVAVLMDSLASAPSATLVHTPADQDAPLIEMSNLGVDRPDGTRLLRGLTLALSPGQRVLVLGPNGVGKSSLLRAILGLWPAAEGELRLNVPHDKVVVLPQRPYVPSNLSLKALMLYPATEHDAIWGVADATLLEALEWAGLRAHATGAADLHRPELVQGLSGGEQQRLAATRLYLRKPALAIMDEPTSACEPAFERLLFSYCVANAISLVTIAHKKDLGAYHTHQLLLEPNGSAKYIEVNEGLAGTGSSSNVSEEGVLC